MSISDFAKQDKPTEETKWDDPSKESPEAEAPEDPPTPESPTDEPTEAPAPAPVDPQQAIVNGILNKIQPIGEKGFLKMMIFGPPGSTKSSFLAAAPKNLIVDFEEGLISATNSPHGIGKGTQGINCTSFEEFVEIIKLVKGRNEALEQYKIFSIDTFSDLHKRGLAEVTVREWRKQPSRNQFVPEVEQHTENNEKLLRIVRALRDLDRHIIISAHSKTVEPKNKPAKTYADFSESLSNKIMAMMDVVGYMDLKEVDGKMVPVLRVVSDGTVHCKTRINLPEEMIDPKWMDIYKAWEESKKPKS